jgi:hypothetical protein
VGRAYCVREIPERSRHSFPLTRDYSLHAQLLINPTSQQLPFHRVRGRRSKCEKE